jgi:hypothetical protein
MFGSTMFDLFKFGFGALGLLIGILGAIGAYKAFQKADKPGIVAFIPILNVINLLDMAGRPVWWILLFLIPGVNLIIAILVMIGVARSFGKGWLFGVGLLVLGPICWLILGFGDAHFKLHR